MSARRVSALGETVARARELRSPGSAAVAARWRGETGAASTVLKRNGGTLRPGSVVFGGMSAMLVKSLALAQASSEEAEDEAQAHGDGHDGDDGASAQAFRLRLGSARATGMQGGELSWGGCAAIKCARGIDALRNSVHDSGGHRNVETGSHRGGVGNGGRSRVVAASVDSLKMHGSSSCCRCAV